ncbi:ribosome biogenesis GTPase Der [Chlamydia psittaci]|uniref:ribosome biogenesis GTPase Der n=1 Tax=Chlamydia psittaci TaxID=83554 RepID=UPI00027E1E9D|nr:ribosome biogenesis GTPase Der [Chlamydia psittaci]AFS21799.1 small GTP-binding domain protein [Chlamydia psittaci MN]KPZ38978.1 GTP-binding protein Der [Chlamydia psittaci str. Frances]MBE3636492.1 ribosome biogenesis GTPase Der [Chlamydia psittaci]CCO02401.1 putative GTP-binding protein [Chlamydia psittaci 01DC12]BEU44585.1 ribosome biogenesis GTPase Der [Chlamydia psittaci]
MLRIAILGRPNVGKSSLFNRMCKRSLAIVNLQEGTTRDRLYGEIRGWGIPVQVIDTGGVDKDSEDHFQKHIYKQALAGANEADILLLVIDIRCGITELDAEIAKQLLCLKKPLILVANKADTLKDEYRIHELYKIGIPDILAVSASHDKHIDNLIHRIKTLANVPEVVEEPVEEIHEEEVPVMESLETEEFLADYENEDSDFSVSSVEDKPLKIALIGRPNVGKSSIINALLNEERCIIDNIPGTTRDNIDILYSYNDRSYLFIDTAGLRKMKSVKNSIEWISSSRTEKAIARADICLLVIDATHHLSSYDKRILSLISKQKKPHIILVNKWDLIQGVRMEHYIRDLRATDVYIGQSKILCISAATKRNLRQIFSSIDELHKTISNKVPTPVVNKTLALALQKHHPQVINGRRLRVYYAIHKTATPFQFLLFINAKSLLTKHYECYLKNTLKSAFNLYGVPFDLEFKEKTKRTN